MRAIVSGPLCVLALASVGPAAGQPVRPPHDSGWVVSGNSRLYYESAGRGPAIVFIHGGLVDRRMWDRQFSALSTRFRVIRYDRRGFGRSDFPTEPFSQVADLAVLMRDLHVERATIVGLSFGGLIALEFALEHPERAERLILAGSDLRGYPQQAVANRAAIYEAAAAGDVDRAVEMWLVDPVFVTTQSDAAVRKTARTMLTENVKGWSSIPAEFSVWPSVPASARLAELRLPTLVIVGALDLPRIRAIADTLAHGIPGARKLVIPAAGHHVNMERPMQFNRAVMSFLTSGPAAGSKAGTRARGYESNACRTLRASSAVP